MSIKLQMHARILAKRVLILMLPHLILTVLGRLASKIATKIFTSILNESESNDCNVNYILG